jgi:hypothetical protein
MCPIRIFVSYVGNGRGRRERGRRGGREDVDILDPYVLLSLEDGSMVLYYAMVQLGDVRLVHVPDKNFRFV